MAVHIFRREATYYWRRRTPRALANCLNRPHLFMSLRTTNPVMARRPAIQLDSVLEDAAMLAEQTDLHLSRSQIETMLSAVVERQLTKLERVALAAKNGFGFDVHQAATAFYRAIISHRITAFQHTPRKLRFAHDAPQPAPLVYRPNPKLLRIRWRLALFRTAWLLRRSLQWRQLRPLLDADADRADLELRLIKLTLKDRARVCIRLPATAAHGAKRL
jgi:hypothetical protein